MTALDGVGLQSSLHGIGKEGGRFLKGSQFPESPLNQHWMIESVRMVKCHHCSVYLSTMSENSQWDDDVVNTVRKYALQNSLEYDGRGEAGSVLGRLLSERDDLRKFAKELKENVNEVDEVNDIANREGLEHIRDLLETLAPDALERKHVKIEGLKELPGDRPRSFSGLRQTPMDPSHLGILGVVINAEYARIYGGKVVLRFDDTDTKVTPIPDAYHWMQRNMSGAGRPADVIIRLAIGCQLI